MTPRAQFYADCLAGPAWAAIVEEMCALLDDTRASDAATVEAIVCSCGGIGIVPVWNGVVWAWRRCECGGKSTPE